MVGGPREVCHAVSTGSRSLLVLQDESPVAGNSVIGVLPVMANVGTQRLVRAKMKC